MSSIERCPHCDGALPGLKRAYVQHGAARRVLSMASGKTVSIRTLAYAYIRGTDKDVRAGLRAVQRMAARGDLRVVAEGRYTAA